jgi:hypothetical protein
MAAAVDLDVTPWAVLHEEPVDVEPSGPPWAPRGA